MKKNIILSLFALLCGLLATGFIASPKAEKIKVSPTKEKIEWLTLPEAMEKIKTTPRPIFIDVYTDWCGWCKKMDKVTFQDETVVAYVKENYYAVKIDAESEEKIKLDNDNELSYRELSGGVFRISGYPSIVLITPKNEFQVAPGFRDKDDFLAMLKQFKADSEKK